MLGKSDINSHCANCGTDLEDQSCAGASSLYTGCSRFGIGLCEMCWLIEDDLIEQKGTNVLPERVRHYLRMIEQHSRVGTQVYEWIKVPELFA